MTAGPFTEVQPSFGTRFRWLLGRHSVEDALLDINNRLARAGVRAFTFVELERVRVQHRVPERELQRRLERFYRNYLIHCFEDAHLSDEEVRDLEHLRVTLGLPAETVDMIHRTVVRRVYSRSVEQILEDGTIDSHERTFLARLREHLALPDEIAENIEDMKERQWRKRHPGQ